MDERNNIDNSLRDRFGPSGVGNEGWNDPSDIVWDNIEREIYKEEKSRFGYLPFILVNLLILAAIVISFLLHQNAELKSIVEASKNEVGLTQPVAQVESIKENTQPVKDIETKNTSGNTDAQRIFSAENSSKQSDPIQYKNVSSEFSKLQTQVTDVSEPTSVVITKNEDRRNAALEAVNQVPPSGVDQQDEQLLAITRKLEMSPALVRHQYILDYERSIEPLHVSVEQEQNNGPNLIRSISVLPQFFMNNLSTNGTQESPLNELINREYGNEGFGIDIQISEPISKTMEFTYGLGVESMSYSTEYFLSLPYSSDQEDIDGLHGYIDFEHSLPTAFGNTDTELRLIRVRSTNDPVSETVDLDFHTNHRFFTISAPVGLNKVFGSNNSQFRIGVQARPTYLLHGGSSIKAVRSHHSQIDAVNNQSTSVYADVNRFNLGIGLNIGYYKRIANNHGLELNIGLQDFLFDTYAVNNYSTSIQKVGISLGYRYSL